MLLQLVAAVGGLLAAAPPDAVLQRIAISSATSSVAQELPLSMVRGWPVWIARPDGTSVTLVPNEDTLSDHPEPSADDLPSWVDPVTFEQLWLPEDLTLPTSNAALGMVLKNGAPRVILADSSLNAPLREQLV